MRVEPEEYQVVHGRYTSKPGTKNQKLFPILHICQNRVLNGQTKPVTGAMHHPVLPRLIQYS